LKGGVKEALSSYQMIRDIFRKHPGEMGFLKGPFAIVLSNQTELEELLKEGG